MKHSKIISLLLVLTCIVTLCFAGMTMTAQAGTSTNVIAVTETGEEIEFAGATIVTSETYGLDAGAYAVQGNVELYSLELVGNANLILCDGATLTVTGEINFGGFALTVYGQSGQTGTLKITSGLVVDQGAELTINSGNVKVTADDGTVLEIGEHFASSVTVNGGTLSLTTTGNGQPVEVYNGAFTINGGTVTMATQNAIAHLVKLSGGGATFTVNEAATYSVKGGKAAITDTILLSATITVPTVSYVDSNGETKTASKYTLVTSSDDAVMWTDGIYVVKDADVSIDGEITADGNVTLILCDGAKLSAYYLMGIMGKALTVYGQENQTGALALNYGAEALMLSGTMTVNGGNISATCTTNFGAGISIGGTLIVNAGTLTAKSGLSAFVLGPKATVTLAEEVVIKGGADEKNATSITKADLTSVKYAEITVPTVSYVDANDEAKTASQYTLVNSSANAVTWGDGVYVVKSADVGITGAITVNGDVTLILCDGAKLSGTTLNVTSGATLTVYGQEKQTGALALSAGDDISLSVSGTMTVNGGKVETASGYASSLFVAGDGSLTVNAGTHQFSSTIYAIDLAANASITVNGGAVNVYGDISAFSLADTTSVINYVEKAVITGGADKENATSITKADLTSVKYASITVPTAVAQIGDTTYETLADAYKAAKKGDVVKFLVNTIDDIVCGGIPEGITLEGADGKTTVTTAIPSTATVKSVTFRNLKFTAGKAIDAYFEGASTFDTCEFAPEKSFAFDVERATTNKDAISVSFKSCIIKGSISIDGNNIQGSFTDCTFTGKVNGICKLYFSSSTTFEDCTFTDDYISGVSCGITVENSATIELKNCSLSNDKSAGKITDVARSVNNGCLVAFDAEKNADGKYISGTFATTGSADDLNGKTAAGVTLNRIKTGLYEIVTAKIGDVSYKTVQAAYNSAKTGDTITLLSNIKEAVKFEANKTITIDLAGHVWQGDGKTAVIYHTTGNLTLTDSSKDVTHKFDKTNALWVLAADDATGDNIVTVTGGVITGGTGYLNAITYGGAIYTFASGYTAKFENINFVGNTATDGGAIFAVQSLQITGCSFMGNTAKNGGAIDIGSQLTVTSCTFTNNTASESGGAIYIDADLTLTGTTFSGNKAKDGGAIWCMGDTLTATSCTFSKNAASASGGAIYSYNALTVYGCSFTENSAVKFGGAIYVDNDGSAKILDYTDAKSVTTHTTFTKNTADDCGGAILSFGSTLEVTNATFTENSTKTNHGGAIWTKNTTTVTGATFSKNAAKNGGAILNEGTLTVTDTTFSENSASERGGAIWTKSNMTVTGGSFTKNSAANRGGAILINSGTSVISSASFIGNSESNMGGGAIYNYGTLTVKGCAFTENEGSAIFNNNPGSVTIEDYVDGKGAVTHSTFTGNYIEKYQGGAIVNKNGTAMTITGAVFTKNAAKDGSGGAIWSNSTLTLTNVTFSENTAANNGGAVYSYGTNEFYGCSFTENTAKKFGGAICVDNGGSAKILDYTDDKGVVTHSTFTKNTADDCGGAILSFGATLEVTNATFTENSAKKNYGGAIWTKNITNVTGATFSKNTAQRGAAIYGEGTLTVTDGTFSENAASNRGGALFGNNTMTVMGCSFTENTADYAGGAVYIDQNATAYIKDAVDVSGAVTSNTFTKNTSQYGGALYMGGNSTVDISHASFTENKNTAYGGAIYSNGTATLTVKGCSFAENGSTDNYSGGGAIYHLYGTLTVEDYVDGVGSVTHSTFTGNKAAASGGAILSGGTLNVTNATFSENAASGNGGAISGSGTLNVTNATFSKNAASGKGGAILGSGTLNVAGSTFTENTANSGGAIHADNSTANIYDYVDGTGAVTSNTFTKNTARAGGAIYISPNSTVEISHASFTGNKETYLGGGAIYSSNCTLTVKGCSFKENVSDDGGYNGGAIKNYYGTLTVEDYVDSKGTVTHSTFTGNKTIDDGGAIYSNSNSTLTITNAIFEGNETTQTEYATRGGALIVCDKNVILTGCSFKNNKTGLASGGTVYISGNTLTATDITIQDNVGGGIYGAGNAVIILKGTVSITGNTAKNQEYYTNPCGGIYTTKDITLDGKITITGNTWEGVAANLCMNNANATITSLTAGSSIGVTKMTKNVVSDGILANDTTETNKAYFTSDSEKYFIDFADGALKVAKTDKTLFEEYRDEMALDMEGNELLSDINGVVAKRIDELKATAYDPAKTLADNKAVADVIRLKASFDVQKEKTKKNLDNLGRDVNSIITAAKKAINDLPYDASKTLTANKAAVICIADTAELDLNKAKFKEYRKSVLASINKYDGLSADTIATMTSEINAVKYVTSKSLDDNKALIDAIIANYLKAEDLNVLTFNARKADALASLETLGEDCDNVIADAKKAIEAITYNSGKRLNDQIAAIDAIANAVDGKLAAAKFEVAKKDALKKIESFGEDAGNVLADATKAITAMSYDSAKTLDENKAAIEKIVSEASVKLATAKLDEIKKDALASIEALGDDMNDILVNAKAEIDALAAEGKTFDEIKAALAAIVSEAETKLTAAREEHRKSYEPQIVDGANQKIDTTVEGVVATFRSEADFSEFVRVEVDGATVDPKNYDVSEGSTVVTMHNDYLLTLASGEHTLNIVSVNGTAQTTFTLTEGAEAPAEKSGSPVVLIVVIAVVVVAAAVAAVVILKKKKK